MLLDILNILGDLGDYDIPDACRADRLNCVFGIGLINGLGDFRNLGNLGRISALLLGRYRLNVNDYGLDGLDVIIIGLLFDILNRLNVRLGYRIVGYEFLNLIVILGSYLLGHIKNLGIRLGRESYRFHILHNDLALGLIIFGVLSRQHDSVACGFITGV